MGWHNYMGYFTTGTSKQDWLDGLPHYNLTFISLIVLTLIPIIYKYISFSCHVTYVNSRFRRLFQ